MNVPGVHFNNSNWPHILHAVRTWSVAMMFFYAPVYFLARRTCSFLASEGQQVAALMILYMAILFGGLFVPIYVMGRKYQ